MVGEIFVGILTVLFVMVLWAVAGIAPVVGGMILFDYLRDQRRFGRSRVGEYSWLFITAYWIAIVLYYALYLAIFFASYATSLGGDVR